MKNKTIRTIAIILACLLLASLLIGVFSSVKNLFQEEPPEQEEPNENEGGNGNENGGSEPGGSSGDENTVEEVYTVTFKARDEVVSTQQFTKSTKDKVVIPSYTIPGYTVVWPGFDLPDSNITISAICNVKTYTAHFIIGDEEAYNKTFTIESFSEFEYPVAYPTSDGGVSGYWDKQKDHLISVFHSQNTDVYIKGVFTKGDYIVTFIADGEVVGYSGYWIGDSTLSSVPPVPNKEGYIGTWEEYEINNQSFEVHAVYTPIQYSVTFDYQTTGISSTVQFADYGTKLTEPKAPTRVGYDFVGWYNGDVEWDFDADTVKGDITLKAVWMPITYTVTFDSNGGSVVNSMLIEYGSKINKPTAPTKNGYVFECWLYNGAEWDFNAAFVEAKDITLTAKWKVQTNVLEYTLSDDGTYYSVSGIGTCTDTDIVIPSTYNGKPVKKIGSAAFWKNDTIISIVIPDSVVEICSSAFDGCKSLVNIKIGSNVTKIDYFAFRNCISLTNFELPDSLVEIGIWAFSNCDEITRLTFPEELLKIGSNSFGGCDILSTITFTSIPDNVGADAFGGCPIESVYVPWSEGDVDMSTWGLLEDATINYNS